MVQYYNLTALTETSGMMGLFKGVNTASNGWFSIMVLALIFLVPFSILIKTGKSPQVALAYSSFMTAMAGLIFYIAEFTQNSLVIFLPVIGFIITIVIAYKNRND